MAKNIKESKEKLYSLSEAAKLIGVNPETLRRWDRKGIIKALRVGSRHGVGDRRYRLGDLERIMKSRKQAPRIGGIKEKIKNTPQLVDFSEKKRKVWSYLKDLNPLAANAYYGAIKTFQDKANPDRYSQAANSLRELTNILLSPVTQPEKPVIDLEGIKRSFETGNITLEELIQKVTVDPEINGGNITKIKEEISKSGLEDNTALGSARAWATSHNWFTGVTHHGITPTDEEFEYQLALLEDNLLAHTGEFYDAIDEIDKILENDAPEEKDIVKIKSLIKRGSHYRYFFTKLNSPNWLELLEKDKTFNLREPPQATVESDGAMRFPICVETQYLTKIADIKSQEVLQIILTSKKTENPWVHSDYLEAAMRMPSKDVAPIIRKIKKERWFYEPFRTGLPQDGMKLIDKLIEDKENDSAFELAQILMSIQKVPLNDVFAREQDKVRAYEAKCYIDDWNYKELIKKTVPKLNALDPIRTIELLRNIIESAIFIESGVKDYDTEPLLYFRIPSIENITRENTFGLLIVGLREALKDIASRDEDTIKKALVLLEHENGTYPIMRRGQMYIYKLFPDTFEEEIAAALTNPDLFDNIKVAHEYYYLLEKCFGNLSGSDKQKILSWIEAGPKDEESEDYKKHWQARKLLPISEYLNEEWNEYYKMLTRKHTPKPPRHGVTTGTWVGPTSPVEQKKLEQMNTQELVDFLATWQPGEDMTFAPSPEGLGRGLEKIIAADANNYINLGNQLFERQARPVYLYSLIKGVKDAHTKGKKIDWKETLDLCYKLIKDPKPYDFPEEASVFNTNWTSVRRVVADFMEDILYRDEKEVPLKYKNSVLKIISVLAEDPEPDAEYEKEYGGDNMDPATLSINTVRGNALHALIKYAHWFSRKTYPQEENTILAPKIKAILEKHLDPTYDATLTTRSVYGQYFPTLYYLDKNWAKKHIEMIFDPITSPLGESAWETYLNFGTYWVPVVKTLRKQYLNAVKNLDHESPRNRAEDRLAEHLMLSYWRGDIELNDELLVSFFNNASNETQRHAIWFLWRSLEENKLKKESAEWKRLKALWKNRIECKTQDESRKDLSGFADWLSCAPEDITDLYDLIKEVVPYLERGTDVGYLMEYLLENISVNIDLVAELLFYTVERNTEEVKYRLHDGEIHTILKSCMESGSEKAKEFAHKIINLFGDRGNENFRHLRNENLSETVK